MQLPSLPSMALRLVANLQSCRLDVRMRVAAGVFGIGDVEAKLRKRCRTGVLQVLDHAQRARPIGEVPGRWRALRRCSRARRALEGVVGLVDRSVSLKIAYDEGHADTAWVETGASAVLIGARGQGDVLAGVLLNPVETAVDEAHIARVAVFQGRLVVQEGQDGDELSSIRLLAIAVGWRARGDGKRATLISTAKGAVAIVRVAAGGREDTNVPVRRIHGTAVGSVIHPVHLAAGSRRPSLPKAAEASVGLLVQFAAAARVNAVVGVELITEIARRRVKVSER
jgi:hypothetical protein